MYSSTRRIARSYSSRVVAQSIEGAGLKAEGAPSAFNPAPSIDCATTREEYERAIRRVLEYIAAGDCYQVNLSHRFTAALRDPPWVLYGRWRRARPAPYAG